MHNSRRWNQNGGVYVPYFLPGESYRTQFRVFAVFMWPRLVTDNFGLFTDIYVCKFSRGWRSYGPKPFLFCPLYVFIHFFCSFLYGALCPRSCEGTCAIEMFMPIILTSYIINSLFVDYAASFLRSDCGFQWRHTCTTRRTWRSHCRTRRCAWMLCRVTRASTGTTTCTACTAGVRHPSRWSEWELWTTGCSVQRCLTSTETKLIIRYYKGY